MSYLLYIIHISVHVVHFHCDKREEDIDIFDFSLQTTLVMSNVVKISVISSAVLLGLWTTRVDINDIYLMVSQRWVGRENGI